MKKYNRQMRMDALYKQAAQEERTKEAEMKEEVVYKYLTFKELSAPKCKTKTWSCQNERSNKELGQIKWHGAWRRYCYFPTIQAVYSADCLLNIVHFLERLKEKV